jgi:hypothetical protein
VKKKVKKNNGYSNVLQYKPRSCDVNHKTTTAMSSPAKTSATANEQDLNKAMGCPADYTPTSLPPAAKDEDCYAPKKQQPEATERRSMDGVRRSIPF